MSISPSHCVVFLDRTVLYYFAMRICSIILAQHFNDIHIHTYVYSVTPVTAQNYKPVYTQNFPVRFAPHTKCVGDLKHTQHDPH